MAEIHIEKKNNANKMVWIIPVLLILAAIWWFSTRNNTSDGVVGNRDTTAMAPAPATMDTNGAMTMAPRGIRSVA